MFSSKGKNKKKMKKVPPSAPASAPRAAPDKARPAKVHAAATQDTNEDRETRPAATESSSLNQHLAFEGTLKFSGTVLVDCEFRGNIVTDDTLVVGVSGKVHAEVTAGVVEISGVVYGNIKAGSSVKIFSGGAVHGNIETPTISMEEGVVFEGNCTRPGKTPAPAPAAPVAAASVSQPAEPKPTTPSLVAGTETEAGRKKMVVTAKELANLT